MDAKVKDCPSCKRQIQLEASFCPYCSARFEVTYQGYCNTCHAIKVVDIYNHCVTCGSEVIDRQPQSRYLGESTSQAVMQEVVVDRSKKKPRRAGCAGCVLLAITLLLLGAGLLYFSQDARNFVIGLYSGTATPAGKQVGPTNDANPSAVAAVPANRPTRTPEPSPTPDIRFPTLSNDALCLITYKYGMNCLDGGEWIQVPPAEFPGMSNPVHLTTCSGQMFLLSYKSLYKYSGGKWSEVGDTKVSYPAWVGCGKGNAAWLVDADNASFFDGVSWTDHAFSSLLPGKTYVTVEGVAVTADQKVWIAVSDAVLHYDGSQWTTFAKDSGFNKDYNFTGIAVDSRGQPWVSHRNGLATYNGKTWTYVAPPASSTVNTILVDDRDRVWVGTDGGVSVYQNGGWQRYPISTSQAGTVNSIALDQQDRLWAATSWGLAVLVKGNWTVYQMSNSDLLMNSIAHVAVLGDGPALPAMIEKAGGSIHGRLLTGGLPLAGARVEVCMKPLGMFFSGSTPCSDQSSRASTATDSEGRYSIPDLPPGYYHVTFQTPDGKWKIVTSALTIGGVQVEVKPGQQTTVEDLDINKD